MKKRNYVKTITIGGKRYYFYGHTKTEVIVKSETFKEHLRTLSNNGGSYEKAEGRTIRSINGD